MTKNDETPTVDAATLYQFEDVPESVNSNEYDPIVAALLAAGEGKMFPLTTATTEHPKALRRFQEAAHRVDRTARKVTQTIDGDNTTTKIRLRPRVLKKSDETAAEETVEADETTEISE